MSWNHFRLLSQLAGHRRLLHSDPLATAFPAGDVVVAGGLDSAYYVKNMSMDVLIESVEFHGMGKVGEHHPAVELSLPGMQHDQAHCCISPNHCCALTSDGCI